MQLDDVKSITGVSDATISPDGSQIAYIITKPDFKSDKNRRTLMVYDVRSAASRALTFERTGLASPAWSPDASLAPVRSRR